jgi:hypothetical protein
MLPVFSGAMETLAAAFNDDLSVELHEQEPADYIAKRKLEVAKLFIQGCKNHLPAKKALKSLGIEGEGWEPVIRRTDLDLYSRM